MKQMERASGKKTMGLALVPKAVRRVEAEQVVREATTGSVVSVVAASAGLHETAARPRMMLLPRIWAVAETGEAREVAAAARPELAQERAAGGNVSDGLAFYRKYTEATLRRFVRLSMEVGRAPSLLGRELFRGKVSNYTMTTFEDVVIFCFDMERMLRRLEPMHQQLVKRIGMQEYTRTETASMLRMSERHCLRVYEAAIDRLTEMLLEGQMLNIAESCQ